MIDIVFNDKTYSVDESIYNNAKNEIKEYLTTVMNGSGAVINLDGVDYDVSSTMLNETTAELVEYLTTELSGTGAAIVINGVSYSVDASKLQSTKDILDNALTELENTAPPLAPGLYQTGAITIYENGDYQEAAAMLIKSWEELEADKTVAISEGEPEIVLPEQPPIAPTMNEYGFYYGVKYSMGTSVVVTFNEDGSAVAIIEGERTEIPAGAIVYSDHFIDLTAINYGTAVVSEDGTQLEFAGLDDVDGLVLTTNLGVYRCGVYLSVPYYFTFDNLTTILTFNADSSVTVSDSLGTTTEIPADSIVYGDHLIDMTDSPMSLTFEVSQDGTQLVYQELIFNIGTGRPPKGTVYLPKLSTDVVQSIVEGDLVLPSDGSAISINKKAFLHQTLLTGVLLPDSINTIGEWAFYGCTGLRSITFEGAIEQWNTIIKGDVWNAQVPATYIQCSDGQVAL